MKLFDGQIELTDEAVKQINLSAMGEEHFPEALRIGVAGGGCSGFMYVLDFVDEIDPEEDFVDESLAPLKVVTDELSMQYLKGVQLDYIKSLQESGFKFSNPNTTRHCGCGSSFSG